jgi:hypothetical protein
MLERLPDRYLNRRTAEAITAPSAILLAGAGAAVAIVAGLPIAAAAGVGALAWAARVALGLPKRAKGDRIDAFTLSAPWRRPVHEAQQAQRRFQQAVRKADPGPLRDRLVEIGARIDTGVRECWRIAQRGDAMEEGLAHLDIEGTQRELVDVEREMRNDPDDRLAQARDSLRAQLHSAQRMIDAIKDAQMQLRLLDARLDEAVTRAIELSLRSAGDADVSGLGSDVERLVEDMEALRAALEDVDATGTTGTGSGEAGTATA